MRRGWVRVGAAKGVTALLLLSALAACSSASPTGRAAATTPTNPPAVSTQSAPTPPPGAKQAPEAPHDVPDLEALIPDTVGGLALTKSSHHAAADDGIDTWATGVGKTRADVDLASATTTGNDLRQFLTCEVIRMRGADAGRVRDVLLAAQQAGPGPATEEVVGGKSVSVVRTSTAGGSPTRYAYASADVLYLVSAVDPELAAQFLASLS
jgi:hypothetical protein